MNGFIQHLSLSLRLHFRNRMALVYGYLFPLIFLVAYLVLYRHDRVPLLRHFGELLTVGVLGGACFGLPTTLVSERERGVWRRYRLVPIPTWALVTSTALARYFLLLSAGLLQFAVASAVGMTAPAHPLGLLAAFTLVAFAFIGLGLVIAMLADTVPAVQALGQCLFLPLLIIGGVAVPLANLPEWAQHLSAFFPGRYAVEALQANVTGDGLATVGFSLVALTLTGCFACITGAKLFRWDRWQRHSGSGGRAWVGFVLVGWIAMGLVAEWKGQVAIAVPPAVEPSPEPKPVAESKPEPVAVPVPVPPWEKLTVGDIARLDFNVPPDRGVVTPFESSEPEDYLGRQVDRVRSALPNWQPGYDGDAGQQVRNLLCVAAVPDVVQLPEESYFPLVVLDYLNERYPRAELIKILTWIALNPDGGTVRTDLTDLGLSAATSDVTQVRDRSAIYAVKFVARLTGRVTE